MQFIAALLSVKCASGNNVLNIPALASVRDPGHVNPAATDRMKPRY